MASPRGRSWQPAGVARALVRLFVLIVVGFAVGLIFGVVTEEPELLAGHLRGDGETVAIEGAETEAVERRGDLPVGEVRDADESISGKTEVPGSAVYASAPQAIEPLRTGERPRPATSEEAAGSPRPPVASARSKPRGEALRPAPTPASRPPPQPRALPVAQNTPPPESARASAIEPAWSIQVGAFSEQGTANRVAESLQDRYPVAVLPGNSKGGRWRVRVQPISGENRAREIADRLKRDEQLPTWVTPMEAGSAP